jgi:hypothetical protein
VEENPDALVVSMVTIMSPAEGDADTDALGETDGLTEADGLLLADGLTEGETLALAVSVKTVHPLDVKSDAAERPVDEGVEFWVMSKYP